MVVAVLMLSSSSAEDVAPLTPECMEMLEHYPLQEGFSIGSIGRTLSRLPKTLRKPVDALKKPIQQGIRKTSQAMNKLQQQITGGFRKMTSAIAKVEKTMLSAVKKLEKQITGVVKKVESTLKALLAKITSLVQKIIGFLTGLVKWIGAYAKCGFDKLVAFPQCWYIYGMEMLGQLCYLPIRWLVWGFSLQSVERSVWRALMEADDAFYEWTSAGLRWIPDRCPTDPWATDPAAPATTRGKGWHLFRWSEEVKDRCYRCRVTVPPPRV